jgi:hypothetical protein
MGNTTELRRAIKSRFVPFLTEQGFAIDQSHAPAFVDFRRFRNGQVHCIEIQWEKYGSPRFALNVGAASDSGTKWGEMKTAAANMGPAQCPECIRLYPNKVGGSTRRWFRQDNTLLKTLLTMQRRKPASEVVDQLIAFYPEVDAYLNDGIIGPHCQRSPGSWVNEA